MAPAEGASHPGRRYPETDRHKRVLLIVGAITFLAAGGLFLAIAEDVASGDPIVRLDQAAANWLHAHARPGLTRFLEQVSLLHGVAAITAYTAALSAFLALERDWYWVRRVLVVVGGGMPLNWALKLAYQRLRPAFTDAVSSLTTFSFPSGHTAGAMLFYGILALVLASRLSRASRRALCFVPLIVLVPLVAFSRMYLGVHFMSDVIAAACASVAWIAFVLMVVPKFERAG